VRVGKKEVFGERDRKESEGMGRFEEGKREEGREGKGGSRSR